MFLLPDILYAFVLQILCVEDALFKKKKKKIMKFMEFPVPDRFTVHVIYSQIHTIMKHLSLLCTVLTAWRTYLI